MRYLLTIPLSFVPLIILGQELLVNVSSTSKGDSISSPSTQDTYIKKKGKNGRRPYRQLGYAFVFRENTFNVQNAFRHGLMYSSGHIKDKSPVGFLSEFFFGVYSQKNQSFSREIDHLALTGTLLFGILIKFFKSDKILVYGKAGGGVVASNSSIVTKNFIT
jgi:hypothetical protein